MMKWCNLKDERNRTQKLADILDYNLYSDDSIINDFDCFFIK